MRTRLQKKTGAITNYANDCEQLYTNVNGSKRNVSKREGSLVNSNVEKEPKIEASTQFEFQGVHHSSYEEMVKAKRKRNAQILLESGLLQAASEIRETSFLKGSTKSNISQRGLKRADTNRKRKQSITESLPRRKSGRIAGVKADGLYIADEKGGGKLTVGVENTSESNLVNSVVNGHTVGTIEVESEYRNRINNGDDLSLHQAIEQSGPKWVKEDSFPNAENFVSTLPKHYPSSTCSSKLRSQVSSLKLDDETSVAKVVPERIFSVAFHPSPHKIIAVAGDKKGHIGLWDVDYKSNDENIDSSISGSINRADGVHLFKPHNGAIANLEWNTDGTKLFSVSYDSTVRMFDTQKQTFTEVFAAYDSSPQYEKHLGFNIDTGYKFWTQYGCLDHRNDDGLFLTTSTGSLLHLDLRQEGSITFNQKVSEKKVNTVSLHPNGTTIVTCGLDCQVQLWDIRMFRAQKASPKPISTQRSTRSINSAFFSPSGKHLLSTTMADTIDIISDAHLNAKIISKPTYRIRHDNRTGRWLSTFMARWHPTAHDIENELFVVGSMQQPRTLEIFNGTNGELSSGVRGDALTAVVSRCCFHPSLNSLLVMGGNSSGRVTIARQ